MHLSSPMRHFPHALSLKISSLFWHTRNTEWKRTTAASVFPQPFMWLIADVGRFPSGSRACCSAPASQCPAQTHWEQCPMCFVHPTAPKVGGRKVWGGHAPLSLHSTAARHTPGLHAVPLQWTVGTSAMQTEQCNHIVLCCAAQCRGTEHAALPAPADRKGENGTAPLCSEG